MALEWKGKDIERKLNEAQKLGINETVSDAIVYAMRNHEWKNVTGTLQGSIGVSEFAHRVAKGWRSVWGSLDVSYALALELGFTGTVKVRAHTRRTKRGSVKVSAHSRNIDRDAQPFLRPAADAIYPNLAGNIRKHFQRGNA